MAFKLALDPGHGMSNRSQGKYDCGAVSGGVEEADVALQWALTAKYFLAQANIPFFLTRDDDSDHTPVAGRDDRAMAAGCSHMLSFHCNSSGPGATGTETFYKDGPDKAFAQLIQPIAVKTINLRDRGVKHESKTHHGRLAVMGFRGPCALLEIGFISNPSDRKVFLRREVRIAFAKELVSLCQSGRLRA